MALLADAAILQRFVAGDEVFQEGDEGQTPLKSPRLATF